ncbi:DUF4435 domain-containing protein [Pseudomonas extremorientalis]
MDFEKQTYGFKFKSSWAKKKANFNSDGSLRKTVIVWVEADDDKKFWMKFLSDNLNYQFTFKQPDEAEAADDKTANGCNRVLSLIENGDIELSELQISCLDSDDCFIKSFLAGHIPNKPTSDFIHYTNVYSIENAILEPNHLDRTFEVIISQPCRNLFVPPSEFLLDLSTRLFSCYSKLNFFDVNTNDRNLINSLRARFYSSIGSLGALDVTKSYTKTRLFLDFCSELDNLTTLIDQELIKSNKTADYSEYEEKLLTANITPNNIYLFVKGHKVFDLVIAVFSSVSKKHKSAAQARIRKIYENPRSEINKLNNSWQDYGPLVFGAFCISEVNVDFLSKTRENLATIYA